MYICLEALPELHNQSLQIHVTGIRNQGLKAVQVVIHHLTSLVVGQSLQGIYCIYFCIHQEELGVEVLIKVSLSLDRKNISVQFLPEEVLRPLYSLVFFEEH